MSEEIRNRKIICPYCFHEFAQNQAIFRASVGFDRSELETSGDEGGFGGLLSAKKPATDDPRQLFRKFDPEGTTGNAKLDLDLIEYWKERGGAAGYANTDKNWNLPHIDPADQDTFWKMITTATIGNFEPGPDGFVRDKDGFIFRVLDKYSQMLVDSVRLCPDCHNPLPVADYGKYPVRFISVIGLTSAGKTVYLNQLLTRISEVVENTDYYVGAHNLHTFGEPILLGHPLPASTDDRVMRRPLSVSLINKDPDASDKGITLVFYDIAGENCFNKNGDPDIVRAQTAIGRFIGQSDGLIFLLDPEHIPAFANENIRQHDIANVVNVVQTIRINVNSDNATWKDVPVAICVAKSDTLRGHPRIPADIPFLTPTQNAANGFDRNANRVIHDFLRNLLKNESYSVYSAIAPFQRRAYFAVSAITCGVESQISKYKNQYILDATNERLFRDLRKWVKEWNVRSAEERAHYRRCPIAEIQFEYDQTITQELASQIQTPIFADSVHGDRIYLTLWDVASELNLMGYPKGDPSPLRIGEPLKWIMWQLNIIGPEILFDPPPTKRWYHTTNQYLSLLDEYNAQCEAAKELFYWRDADSI